ncbi:mCG1033206, partial [Mus musculus]
EYKRVRGPGFGGDINKGDINKGDIKKTPCYREDSELHHGEGVVNKGSCKTDC